MSNNWRNPNIFAPKCPSCGTVIDAASGVSGRAIPIPGSISICAYCTGLAIFDDQLALRELEDEELAALQQNPAWEIITKVQAEIEKHPLPRRC